jgi:hypothetical protein
MHPVSRFAIALILLPTIASAQRGGGGGGAGGSRVRGDPKADYNAIAGDKGAIKLSNRDVEDMSPIKLLIDKRKDLKLSDDQLKKLKDIESKLKETNDPSFRALDSLRRAAQPPLHEASDDEKSRMMTARRTFAAVVGTIRGNYETSLGEAQGVLDDTQKTRANELTEKQKQEAQDTIREKLGGGRG